MQIVMSSLPRPELRPYVRAYAQRVCRSTDPIVVVPVPAQLEQILNFEFGVPAGLHHRIHQISDVVWMGGSQTTFPGHMDLLPGGDAFAVFFQPNGLSLLFKVPVSRMINCLVDGTALGGSTMRALWNRLGEVSAFESRVSIVEEFLLDRVSRVSAQKEIAAVATYIFSQRGAVRIAELASAHSLSLRQFERNFEREIGVSPKTFARVARFQSALDAKLVSPCRTWLDIAHSFGYHDQMHMIHDFEGLSGNAPSQLLNEMGEIRPPALAAEES